MKVKSFKEHLEKRLNKKGIAEIEMAAKIEYETFKRLQVIYYVSRKLIWRKACQGSLL